MRKKIVRLISLIFSTAIVCLCWEVTRLSTTEINHCSTQYIYIYIFGVLCCLQELHSTEYNNKLVKCRKGVKGGVKNVSNLLSLNNEK